MLRRVMSGPVMRQAARVMLVLWAGAGCWSVPGGNRFMDAGVRARGEPCSRDVQCALPYRCVAFVCDFAPDAAISVDSGMPDAAVARDASTPDAAALDGGEDLDAGPDGG